MKDILYRGISLGLVLAMVVPMMMPMAVFGEKESDKIDLGIYEKQIGEIKNGIKEQNSSIVIKFPKGEGYPTDYIPHVLAKTLYEIAKQEVPVYAGELNIIDEKIFIQLDEGSDKRLDSASYDIEYRLKKDNMNGIKSILADKAYRDIKSQITDYERIKAAYDFVVGALSDEEDKVDKELKEILLPKEDEKLPKGYNAHAFLFAMLMDELGYENGFEEIKGTKRNTVRLYGKQYYVDEWKVIGKDGAFLKSKDDHSPYNESSPTKAQIEYEIEMIQEEINKIGTNEGEKWSGKIGTIEENISLGKIEYAKGQIKDIKERIEIYKGRIAVLETEAKKNQDIYDGLSKKFNELETSIEGIRKKIEGLEDNIQKLETAIEDAEKCLREDDIDNANEKMEDVNNINLEFMDKQLKDRIENINTAITAITAVNEAESIIKKVPEEDSKEASLSEIINEAEADVKTAEAEVKKIKDTVVRTNQQNRIKAIKLVITAMKAVEKAETEPLKESNVKPARTAIEKINKDKYGDNVVKALGNRLDKIEEKIGLENEIAIAEKAVEKAEKSMKEEDIGPALNAIDKLEGSDEKDKLNNRIEAIRAMNELEKALEEYLKDPEKDEIEQKDKGKEDEDEEDKEDEDEDKEEKEKSKLQKAINRAKEAIKEDKIGEIPVKAKYKQRIEVIEYTKIAMEAIMEVEKDVNKENIQKAQNAINRVEDSKIKKELEDRLKEIISEQEKEKNKKAVDGAIGTAQNSIKSEDKTIDENIEAVKAAEELVKKLPNGDTKKQYQNTIKELYNVIKAKQILRDAEVKEESGTLTEKDVIAAEKAISTIKREHVSELKEYITDLEKKVKKLRKSLEDTQATELLKKAKEAVEKAEQTKLPKDIAAAKKAVSLVKDEGEKKELTAQIEALEYSIAKEAVEKAEESARFNDKSTSKDITAAEKAVEAISNKDRYGNEIKNLNGRIKAMRSYLEAIKVLENAEKNMNSQNLEAAKAAQKKFVALVDSIPKVDKENEGEQGKDGEDYKAAYDEMKDYIKKRIERIDEYLKGEKGKETEAQKVVEKAEKAMRAYMDDKESDIEKLKEAQKSLLEAQKAVDGIIDKKVKADLQKQVDAIDAAITAKAAIEAAEAYMNASSVKEAEKALNDLIKTKKYPDIVSQLGNRVAKLKTELDYKLNISKKVDEATKLVQKAIDSRKEADVARARFEVNTLLELIEDKGSESYKIIKNLDEMLVELEDSIKSGATAEEAAYKAAKNSIDRAIKEIVGYYEDDIDDKDKDEDEDNKENKKDTKGKKIEGANAYIGMIIRGQDDQEKYIKLASDKIQSARDYIIQANDAVRKLSDQNSRKGLLEQINNANKEIDLSEDNLYVKKAVMLTDIASESVIVAMGGGPEEVEKAKGDIAAARRAADMVKHNNNKDVKRTIIRTIDSVEKKLYSDNDQELIDKALKDVNDAADALSNAVRDNKIMDKDVQRKIESDIFAADLSIGMISDNNKVARETLSGFIQDIKAAFEAEKEGIANEERIRNATKAVEDAEAQKGKDELDSYIRIARLRVRLIKENTPQDKIIKEELNSRLDALEGKIGGGPGSGGKPGSGSKPGDGSSGGGKGGNSSGNKTPTSPLSDRDRVIGSTEPVWGKTKTLKKTNPATNIFNYNTTIYRSNNSRMRVMELSNTLNTMPNAKVRLTVRGKNINLGSKPYIHDKANNNILLPIRAIGDEFGYLISMIDSPSMIGSKRLLLSGNIYGEIKTVAMDIGSDYSYVGGNLVRMNSKPIIQNGKTYIPMDFMIDHLGLSFNYYYENGNIQLTID